MCNNWSVIGCDSIFQLKLQEIFHSTLNVDLLCSCDSGWIMTANAKKMIARSKGASITLQSFQHIRNDGST